MDANQATNHVTKRRAKWTRTPAQRLAGLDYRRRIERIARAQFRVIGAGADAKDSGRLDSTEKFVVAMQETGDQAEVMLLAAEKALAQTVGAAPKIRAGVVNAISDNLAALTALAEHLATTREGLERLLGAELEPAAPVEHAHPPVVNHPPVNHPHEA